MSGSYFFSGDYYNHRPVLVRWCPRSRGRPSAYFYLADQGDDRAWVPILEYIFVPLIMRVLLAPPHSERGAFSAEHVASFLVYIRIRVDVYGNQ